MQIYCEYVASYSQLFFDSLTEITKLQNLSSVWKLHRLGRIIASNFCESVIKVETQKGKNSLLKLLVKQADELHVSRECPCIKLWKAK